MKNIAAMVMSRRQTSLLYVFFLTFRWNWLCTTFIEALLGADHLTFEGGGWVGDFEKKELPASTCRKKKIASAQME